MGSDFKRSLLEDRTRKVLRRWHEDVRRKRKNYPLLYFRSFGAQLLANAQAATTAAADKKPVVVPADGAAVVKVATKATKKVTVKPKPEKVTEINPDKKPKEEPESSSLRRRSSRKKVNTLTKVLTARSKMEHNSCHFNCMQRYGPVYLDHSTTIVKVPVQHG